MQVKLDLILVFPSTFNLYGSIWIWEPKSAKTQTHAHLKPKIPFCNSLSKRTLYEQSKNLGTGLRP